MVNKASTYTETEREVFAGIASNMIYGFMLSALRSKDKGSAFYIHEITVQNEPERLCRNVSDIAGEICSHIFHNRMSENEQEKMYAFATKEGWKIYKGEKTVQDAVKDFN